MDSRLTKLGALNHSFGVASRRIIEEAGFPLPGLVWLPYFKGAEGELCHVTV
ncbi:hypothetical protein BN874_520007 [Candidatus Contendobacter odensis Run_B_J11]|uniref:Uncharacterized protein n=1 Tax=Candidatus Contendobacter odensis Run_B_J11 TaxID=1400861 RepID=A0A7U7J3U9_9GAMM|nr:hypothetical protein BN874_520007 [Candidatus Contendobacter odensis Run_B_J11]